ncbi:hypothetical protein DFJ73DRAFT_842023 [Zopfochytrium polystomum]|nr:hypothetical protein DFJ73DRAFT_842023 [Zopfochytrium polystomum]
MEINRRSGRRFRIPYDVVVSSAEYDHAIFLLTVGVLHASSMALLLFLLLHQRLSENQRRQEALCLTSFTLQWLVSAIFWLAVFPELEGPIGLAQRIVLTFEHSFPLAVHIFESFNGSLALQPRDAGYPILFVLVYVLWMLFYHTVFGWAWPYPFMPQLVASPLTFAVSVLGLVLTVASCAGWTLLFHFYIIREVRRLLLGNAHSGTESLLLGD